MAINYLYKARRRVGSSYNIVKIINTLSDLGDGFAKILIVSPSNVYKYMHRYVSNHRNINWVINHYSSYGGLDDVMYQMKGGRWDVAFILDIDYFDSRLIDEMMYIVEGNSREVFVELTKEPEHEIYTND